MNPDPMAKNLLSTEQAAELINAVTAPNGWAARRQISPQTLRGLIRDGQLQRAGVEVVDLPGRYYLKKDSLLRYLWLQAQDTARRCEQAMGITQERTYEIIGEVGERHHGHGKAMDAYWRQAMMDEFLARAEEDAEDVGKAAWGELDGGES